MMPSAAGQRSAKSISGNVKKRWCFRMAKWERGNKFSARSPFGKDAKRVVHPGLFLSRVNGTLRSRFFYCNYDLLNDDIYQPAWNNDDVHHFFSGDDGLDLLVAKRAVADRVFRSFRRN